MKPIWLLICDLLNQLLSVSLLFIIRTIKPKGNDIMEEKTEIQANRRFEKNKKGYFRNPYGVIKKLIDEISIGDNEKHKK